MLSHYLVRSRAFFSPFPAVNTVALMATQNYFKSAVCNISVISLIKSVQSTAGVTDSEPERCVHLYVSELKTMSNC